MLPKSAWSASDRAKWGKQAAGVGQHRVLMALWDHAHGWREGDGDWFVWPSIDTICAHLGVKRSAVYHALAELRRRGWLEPAWNGGHRGWWLLPVPIDRTSGAQLDLFASEPDAVGAVDNLGTDEIAASESPDWRSRIPDCASSTGTKKEPPADDDTTRAWLDYEVERVRALGGSVRCTAAPESMRALVVARGLPAVIAYGRRAIELAAEAVACGAPLAEKLVKCRSDGGEWSERRLAAVAAFQSTTVPRPIVMPAPDPIVDDRPVDRHERAAWDSGGKEAVRALRRSVLSPDAMAAMARDALRVIGGGR